MKKFKKIIALCISAIMVIGCTFLASAADNPEYLYDEVEYYYSSATRANSAPGQPYDVVLLPNESGSFSYDFTNQSTQYSDFIISPQTSTTGIRMIFKATSESHNLTMKVIRKDTGDIVYNDTISVLRGFEAEFVLSSIYLEQDRGYYIELSNPSKSGASGIFTIKGC